MKTPFRTRRYGKLSHIEILFLLLPVLAHGQEKYTLRYQFTPGEKLQYKTERHDSITTQAGGQSNQMNFTNYMLQTLAVDETGSDNTFSLSVNMDSTWSDQDTMSVSSGGGSGERRSYRMSGGPGGGRGPETYKVTPTGKSATAAPVMSPLILTLPEEPVSINSTWSFEKNSEVKGRRQGTTKVTGECLFYGVDTQNGRPVALIIVNFETHSDLSFRFETPQGDFSGTSRSLGKGTGLVYFDIEKGRIIEIIREDQTESVNEMSSRGSSEMKSKSNQTIRLVSD
jgi:hypothetical protein